MDILVKNEQINKLYLENSDSEENITSENSLGSRNSLKENNYLRGSPETELHVQRLQETVNKLNALELATYGSPKPREWNFYKIKSQIYIQNELFFKFFVAKSNHSYNSKALIRMERRDRDRRFQKEIKLDAELSEVNKLLADIKLQLNSFTDLDQDLSESPEITKAWIDCINMKKTLISKQERIKHQLDELKLDAEQAEYSRELRAMKQSNKSEQQMQKLRDKIERIVKKRDQIVAQIHELKNDEHQSSFEMEWI